jgi:hypothetical protein
VLLQSAHYSLSDYPAKRPKSFGNLVLDYFYR